MPTVWISAGEISGDLHGGLLAQALRRLSPDLTLVGMAGPAMRAAGVYPHSMTESLSVMGFTEVLAHAGRILGLLRHTRRHLAQVRPDLLVVIDAPDFHFRILTMAQALGIPAIYYISPKLWAWRPGRARFLRNHVKRLISILPFEQEFYARFGMAVDYVGHPLVDAVRTPEVLAQAVVPGRIALLPGSRRRELESLLPRFAAAAQLLSHRHPGLTWVLPVAPGLDHDHLRTLWSNGPPVHLVPAENRYSVLRTCQLALAASGTVTLETALLEVPTVVAYRFSALTFALGKRLVRVPWIALPNLILGKEVFPELLQDRAHPAALAAHLSQWLTTPDLAQEVRATLSQLPAVLGGGGAVHRAARIILEELHQGERI